MPRYPRPARRHDAAFFAYGYCHVLTKTLMDLHPHAVPYILASGPTADDEIIHSAVRIPVEGGYVYVDAHGTGSGADELHRKMAPYRRHVRELSAKWHKTDADVIARIAPSTTASARTAARRLAQRLLHVADTHGAVPFHNHVASSVAMSATRTGWSHPMALRADRPPGAAMPTSKSRKPTARRSQAMHRYADRSPAADRMAQRIGSAQGYPEIGWVLISNGQMGRGIVIENPDPSPREPKYLVLTPDEQLVDFVWRETRSDSKKPRLHHQFFGRLPALADVVIGGLGLYTSDVGTMPSNGYRLPNSRMGGGSMVNTMARHVDRRPPESRSAKCGCARSARCGCGRSQRSDVRLLTDAQEEDAWNAGYEAASRHDWQGGSDIDGLWLWAVERDARLPRALFNQGESAPKFWLYHRAFRAGVEGYVQANRPSGRSAKCGCGRSAKCGCGRSARSAVGRKSTARKPVRKPAKRKTTVVRAAGRPHARHKHTRGGHTTVQALLFARGGNALASALAGSGAPTRGYSERTALAWCRRHGYDPIKAETTANNIRVRIHQPREFATFRTVTFGKGIKAVVGVE